MVVMCRIHHLHPYIYLHRSSGPPHRDLTIARSRSSGIGVTDTERLRGHCNTPRLRAGDTSTVPELSAYEKSVERRLKSAGSLEIFCKSLPAPPRAVKRPRGSIKASAATGNGAAWPPTAPTLSAIAAANNRMSIAMGRCFCGGFISCS